MTNRFEELAEGLTTWLDADSGEEDDSDDDVDTYKQNFDKYRDNKQDVLNSISDLGTRVTFSRRLEDIEGRMSQPAFAGNPALEDALRRAMAEARAAGSKLPWAAAPAALFPRPPR